MSVETNKTYLVKPQRHPAKPGTLGDLMKGVPIDQGESNEEYEARLIEFGMKVGLAEPRPRDEIMPTIYREQGKAALDEELREELNRVGPWTAEAIKNNEKHDEVRNELLLKFDCVEDRVNFIETYARKGIKDKDRMRFAGLVHGCQYSSACKKLGLPMKKTSRKSKHM